MAWANIDGQTKVCQFQFAILTTRPGDQVWMITVRIRTYKNKNKNNNHTTITCNRHTTMNKHEQTNFSASRPWRQQPWSCQAYWGGLQELQLMKVTTSKLRTWYLDGKCLPDTKIHKAGQDNVKWVVQSTCKNTPGYLDELVYNYWKLCNDLSNFIHCLRTRDS